ncbi:MAG TPA: hypothetical protein PLS21_05250 [Synergistales bacterium]|nr:hypothetical protein [Synergistales bacterium]
MVKTGGNQRQYFPGQEDPPIGHWRFSVAELKEIRELYGMTGSGVNRACYRFENMMERDKDLGERLKRLA